MAKTQSKPKKAAPSKKAKPAKKAKPVTRKAPVEAAITSDVSPMAPVEVPEEQVAQAAEPAPVQPAEPAAPEPILQTFQEQASAPVVENKGRVFSVIGLVCAIISLIFIPILFGPAAIILGIIARNKGDKGFGLVVIILGVVFMIIGILLGLAFALFRGAMGF